MTAGLSGSIVGSAIGGLAKLTGKLALGGAKLTGKAGIGTAKMAGELAIDSAKSGYKGARSLVNGVGKQVLDKGNRVQLTKSTEKVAQNIGNLMTNRKAASVTTNIMTGRKEFHSSKLQLSGIGTTAIAGAFLYRGTKDMSNEMTAERMGQIDERKVTATPVFGNSKPIGPLSGGADGSLVFALHNNR